MRHYTGSGTYAPNEGDPQAERVIEIISAGGGDGCFVVLHHQAGKNDFLRRVTEACPLGVGLVRFYVRNWLAINPRAHARFCVDEMAKLPTKHFTWANEQNLADESGGVVGAAHGRSATWGDYRRIADWNYAFVSEARKLNPDLVYHYPGLAYGHGEDWGYDGNRQPMPGFPVGRVRLPDGRTVGTDGEPVPAYELLRPGIDLCHVLNVHPYVQKGAPVLDEWRGVRRIEKVAALFPGKTLFAAETGDFDVWNQQAPDRILEIAYYLQGRPEVLGYCFFILDSPDPGHAMNNWSNNRAIEEAYRRMTRIARPRAWTEPKPTPPVVVAPPTPAPPKPAPAPAPKPTPKPGGSVNVKLSVGERTALAHPSNWDENTPIGPVKGVVIHSTGGQSSRIETEYDGSVNWAQQDHGDGKEGAAHRIIGAGGLRAQVAMTVPDSGKAYHSSTIGVNQHYRGVEFAHPDTAFWNGQPYTDFQYAAAAELIARWKLADEARGWNWPIALVDKPGLTGLVYHRTVQPADRSDPTGPFDGARLVREAQAWYAKLGGKAAPTPTPAPPKGDAVGDALNGVAHYLNQAEASVEQARREFFELKKAIGR